ncbi:MAG: hypothetical protein ACRDIC_20920, partial [bacterium]
MSTAEELLRLAGRQLTRFLYRDLIYVAGGILVLTVPIAGHGVLGRLVAGPWWLLVVAALAAYGAGFLASEIGVTIGAFRMFPARGAFVASEINHVLQRARATIARREDEMLYADRLDFLKFLSAVFGSSAAVACILLQLYTFFGELKLTGFARAMASLSLTLAVVIMCVRNRRAALVEGRIVERWNESADTVGRV